MKQLSVDNAQARKCGLSYGQWRSQCQENQMNQNYKRLVTKDGFDLTLFCDLYNAGYSDCNIGNRMGCKPWMIADVRKQCGLPHNRITKKALKARQKVTAESLVSFFE